MSTNNEAEPVGGGVVEGAVCEPNISPEGRRARRRIGIAGVVVAVLASALFVALQQPWWVRFLGAFLPMAAGATTWLQARRNTCVMRARQGTFEHADRRTTSKMLDVQVAASRRVAFTIQRDGFIAGVVFGAIVAALPLPPL